MTPQLAQDKANLEQLLEQTKAKALDFIGSIDERRATTHATPSEIHHLPSNGLGADGTLAAFNERFYHLLSASSGPRYWAYVTGGSTPAALIGDWLASAFDQNSADPDPAISTLELEAIHMLRQLFGLSDNHAGSFVTGATMSNFVGLAIGRQWVGQQHGIDIAQTGLAALPPIKILSATAHSSIYKTIAMLGMGRDNVLAVGTLPEREAVDVAALESALRDLKGTLCIVVANAGTVNTVDFDDFAAVAQLKSRYPFWLHVDAAFGGFAACSPDYAHLVRGWDSADSICIDAHKWLNVPYDAAMQFTRHPDLQAAVFRNSASYLTSNAGLGDFVHRTPENSRRWRALPTWFSLTAYGSEGYREIVERNCALAQQLATKIDQHPDFELLTPVRLNGIVFTLANRPDSTAIQHYLKKLANDGRLFLTPTVYKGTPAIRVSIVNWQSKEEDIETAFSALCEATSMNSI